MTTNVLETAKLFATKAHKGQKRATGEEYITHPEAVANLCISGLSKAIAWLHDVVEDTDTSLDDIALHFIDYEHVSVIVEILDALTHRSGEPYLDYILRVRKSGKLATVIKLADIKHNLSTVPKGWKNAPDKWKMAEWILTH